MSKRFAEEAPAGSDAAMKRAKTVMVKRGKSTATQTDVAKAVFRLKRQLHGEVNFWDKNISSGITTTGLITNWTSGIVQGDGVGQRVGNKIRFKSFQARLWVAAGDTSNVMRVIFFIAKDSLAASPTISTVLSETATYPHLSPYNPAYRVNYEILFDQSYTLHAGEPIKIDKFMAWQFKNPGVTYSADGASGNGQIYSLIVSDSAAGAPDPTANVVARLRYTDN